jgi:hypothetical protein
MRHCSDIGYVSPVRILLVEQCECFSKRRVRFTHQKNGAHSAPYLAMSDKPSNLCVGAVSGLHCWIFA